MSKELVDQLVTRADRPEDLLGETGLMKELKIALMERMIVAELKLHQGSEEGHDAPPALHNRRDGISLKNAQKRRH